MMTRVFVIATLVLGGGIALAGPTGTMGQDQPKTGVEMPSGAKLIGTSSAMEIRAFPELNKNKMATGDELTGAKAVDRAYETNKSYKDTVSHFDKMVKDGQATQMDRTTTKSTTAWSLRMTDGTMVNVVVRNTQPTTIETMQAMGMTGEMRTAPSDTGRDTNRPMGTMPGTPGTPGAPGTPGTPGMPPSNPPNQPPSNINRQGTMPPGNQPETGNPPIR
jgi:hypothetical protein